MDSAGRRRDLLSVALAAGFAIALVATRWELSGRPGFLFMVWNLALGLIPVALALPRIRRLFGLQLALWWLFFPNAPYMLTDLIHLQPRDMPYWFDIGMMVAFAWAGLVAAMVSLRWMRAEVESRFGPRLAPPFLAAVALSTGFAIWIGRFLRLNSWDAMLHPLTAIRIVSEALVLGRGAQAVGVTLLFGALFFVVYRTASAERASAENVVTFR